MKHIWIALFFLATAFAEPRRQSHVVVISLDGFSAQALQNPRLPLPNLRKLIAEGSYSKLMHPINPTVTWPNHTAIITGVDASRHSVLYNGLATREASTVKVEPWLDKTELVQGPTVYDIAHENGLTTAEVDWVAILNAKTINWAFPENVTIDSVVAKEMIAKGLITEEKVQDFRKLPITDRDEYWQRAAVYILKTHKPNLSLIHFLTTDSVQHRYAPSTLAADTALSLADQRVGRIMDAIQEAGIAKSTTVIIVSDHGFKAVKKVIHANAWVAKQGISGVYVVPEGGTAMVYILDSAKRAELLPQLANQFAKVEGVTQVLKPEQFAEFGYPSPEKNNRMADLVLAAGDGYGFGGGKPDSPAITENVTPTGSHGYLNTDSDMNAIFIASGAGIRKGVVLPEMKNVDVAPTIAHLLGLELKDVSGKALTEILQ